MVGDIGKTHLHTLISLLPQKTKPLRLPSGSTNVYVVFCLEYARFNDPRKHNAVRYWLRSNSSHLLFGCLLETRVLEDSFESISTTVFLGWNKVANYDYHRLGRIWFLWSSGVEAITLYKGPQLMTFAVTTPYGDRMFVTVVYASNFSKDRKSLWEEIRQNKGWFAGDSLPWIIVGDFNEILTSSEYTFARISKYISLQEFQNMVSICALSDLCSSGSLFTWWNHRSRDPIGKKPDQSLANDAWLQAYPSSYTSFETNGISDHVRSLTYIHESPQVRKTPFRFYNFLIDDEGFLPETKWMWSMTPALTHSRADLTMFMAKIKALKPIYRLLNKHRYCSLSLRTKQAFEVLCQAQSSALQQPCFETFEAIEIATREWHRLAQAEEKLYQQKSKINWIRDGDSNTAFFHQYIKQIMSHQSINQLTSLNGEVLREPRQIRSEAINYYQQFLQQPLDTHPIDEDYLEQIISYRCPLERAENLVAPVTKTKVKSVLDRLPFNKATGPDGSR